MRAIVFLGLFACSVPAPITRAVVTAAAPTVDGRTLVVAGEHLDYRVRMRGLVVGRVQVAVGRPGVVDGHRAIVMTSRGTSDGMVAVLSDMTYEVTTTIDLDSGEVIASVEDFTAEELGGHRDRYHHASTSGHDVHSFTAALRALPVGGALDLRPEMGGGHLEVRLEWPAPPRRSSFRVAGVTVPAIELTGDADTRFAFTVWLSDDAARVPLRFHCATRWGDIDATLTDYQVAHE